MPHSCCPYFSMQLRCLKTEVHKCTYSVEMLQGNCNYGIVLITLCFLKQTLIHSMFLHSMILQFYRHTTNPKRSPPLQQASHHQHRSRRIIKNHKTTLIFPHQYIRASITSARTDQHSQTIPSTANHTRSLSDVVQSLKNVILKLPFDLRSGSISDQRHDLARSYDQ